MSLSLTASFQNSLKTRIKLHKIVHKMSKKIVCGDGVTEKRREGRREFGGKSAVVVGGGIDAPECWVY